MNRKRTLLTLCGLATAGSLCLTGCATQRAETGTASGWSAMLFPWRNLAADSESLSEPPEPPPYDPAASAQLPGSRREPVYSNPGEYYQPRSTAPQPYELIQPPPAPPASDSGFFETEADAGNNDAHRTSRPQPLQPTSESDEPSRLRDLFDAVRGRRTSPPVQRIPLEGPVAAGPHAPRAQTVGFDIPEPVLLRQPEFVE